MFPPKRKAAADDHLQDEVIGAPGQSDTDAKVEFPLWRQVKIDGREYLMLLFALGIKATERPERAIILNSAIDLFGK